MVLLLLLQYHVRYLSPLALQVGSINCVHKTRIHSTQRWHHFGAKTSRLVAPPLFMLDPVFLIQINSYSVLFKRQLDEIHYLETRSCHVNASFIITVTFLSILWWTRVQLNPLLHVC